MNRGSVVTSPEGRPTAPIIVIEKRALVRESLARRLNEEFGCQVISFPDVENWQKDSLGCGTQFILVSAWENDHETLLAVRASETDATLIVLSDATELDDILRSLKAGGFAGPTNKPTSAGWRRCQG